MTSIEHILLCKAPGKDQRYFVRWDWIIDNNGVGSWQQQSKPLPIHGALKDGVVRAIRDAKAPIDLTFSSFRGLADRDGDQTIADGPPSGIFMSERAERTLTLSPLGEPHSDRLVGEMCFVDPGRTPAGGNKFVVKETPAVLTAYFDDFWRRVQESSRVICEELWLRWGWSAMEIAPSAFPLESWRLKQIERAKEADEAAQAAHRTAQNGSAGPPPQVAAVEAAPEPAVPLLTAGIQKDGEKWIVLDDEGREVSRFDTAGEASLRFDDLTAK